MNTEQPEFVINCDGGSPLYDLGRSWRESRVLCERPAACSDLAIAADGSVLCPYETGENNYRERLVLSRFSPDWLLAKWNESRTKSGAIR